MLPVTEWLKIKTYLINLLLQNGRLFDKNCFVVFLFQDIHI